MKKKSWLRGLLFGLGVFSALLGTAASAQTMSFKKADAGTEIRWRNEVVGTYDADGRILFQPSAYDERNVHALESFLMSDDEKTVVFPAGTKIYLDEVLDIGSNTTIIATDAEIIQKTEGMGLLQHAIDGYSYDSLENVTIIGGHWYNETNSESATMLRFIHAANITLQNVTIDFQYAGHAVTFVGSKDISVQNCSLLANGEKVSKSVEEALQLDIAAPNTCPEAAKLGSNYANGQICRNVVIENSTLRGSRGISANISQKYPKFFNKFHSNITIKNCSITASSSEGVALFNTIGYHVENNTIKTTSKWRSGNHSDALHIIIFGKSGMTKKLPNTIIGNKLYGDVHGINMWSMKNSLFGKTTVKKNKIYIKAGKKSEASLVRCCKKIVSSGNKIGKW